MKLKRRWLLALALLAALPARAQDDFVDAAGVDIAIRPAQTYRRAGGQDLQYDLYIPRAASAAKPVPLVLYFHGGGWATGQREIANLRLLPFLKMGFAAANVSYRLASTAPAPAAIEDARCALINLASRAVELGIDPQRIVLAGGSAGAHLALIAGMLPAGSRFDRGCPVPEAQRWSGGKVEPPRVAAVLSWSGISDVNELLQPGPSLRPFALEWFGAMPDAERAALARELSPLTQMRPGLPPVMSFHGDADPVVPFSQAERLHAALTRAGVPNQLVRASGGGHGWSAAQMREASAAMRKFLRETLGLQD